MAKRKTRGKAGIHRLAVAAFRVLTVFSIRGRFMLITGAGIPDMPSSSQPRRSSGTVQPEAPQPQKPAKNEYTLLVNRANPLTSDHVVETRSVTYNGQDSGKLFDVRVADKLEAMLNDAAAAGYPMYLVSTYRTIEYQRGLYNRKVNQYINSGYTQSAAETEAAKWVAPPGTSEHNLGLVADIVSSTWYNENNDLTQEFENTAHFAWLYEHCAEYGFILRYPKGKEGITGIAYEPWHYRYVGREVAKYIMENNITLEEFWEK
ncbi:MAG: M15 family metallopeptidase [Oscillospiraceae bacterium]|nr:M15 family metallopeptidase [Oscillospiraceae bacterium]